MTPIRSFSIPLSLLLVTCAANAQDFEGHFVSRLVTVGTEDLYEIIGDALYEEDPSNLPALLMKLDVQQVAATGSAEVENTRISVRGDLTRIEPEGESEGQGFQIINSSTGTIWIVNVQDRSYLEFTPQTAEDIEEKTREMMEKMGVDPDQVDDIEEYETATGSTASTGRTEQINGYRATAYTYSDEEQVEVSWCASDETNFFQSMMQRATEGAFQGEEDEISGGVECPEGTFPVRTLSLHLFSEDLTIDDLVEVTPASVPASLFEVPEGFKKKDFLEGFFGQ
jgi:hypothetical protein